VEGQHFVLNRVDSVGDVVLALPMAGILRRAFPDCKVSFIATRYTLPVARCCEHLHGIFLWDEIEKAPPSEQIRQFRAIGADAIIHIHPKPAVARLARRARIPLRIGTGRRLFHWFTCNRLVHVHRQRSPLHEAQLNIQLLRGVGIRRGYSLEEISEYTGLRKVAPLSKHLAAHIDSRRFNLVVHPKSGGTSREWPIEHFARLIESLPPARFNLLITGSEQEGRTARGALPMHLPHVQDFMGKLSLTDLISLIQAADGLVAVSTGPLHIAAGLGKHALGIYAPLPSKSARRWGPIGINARVFQLDKDCSVCRESGNCDCMRQMVPEEIQAYLLSVAARQTRCRRATVVP
jgi:ADP-heptose:LPS heptosyltransferase